MNESALLELHYYLREGGHSMDAVRHNKAEAEFLAVFAEVAQLLKIPIQVEALAKMEGGIRDWWKAVGVSKDQLTFILAVVVFIFSRFPASTADPQTEAYNREAARLTVEEKKLNIDRLRRELDKMDKGKSPPPEAVEQAASAIGSSLKVIARRSTFYKTLLKDDKVIAVSFASQDVKDHAGRVERADFFRFVLPTDKLPTEVVENAVIEVVAPVFRDGNHHWKGVYDGETISFVMSDAEFKKSLLRGEQTFQHGTTIECVLLVHRKFDELGDIVVTGHTVQIVVSKKDNERTIQTPQGKRRKLNVQMAAGQNDLFGK